MSNDGNYIYSHATGLAAKTVEQHEAPQDLVFYAGWVSGYPSNSTLVPLTPFSAVLPIRATLLDLP